MIIYETTIGGDDERLAIRAHDHGLIEIVHQSPFGVHDEVRWSDDEQPVLMWTREAPDMIDAIKSAGRAVITHNEGRDQT